MGNNKYMEKKTPPKRIRHIKQNRAGAPTGSKNAERLKTPEERARAFKLYCDHIASGYSGASFHDPCVEKTMKRSMETYPDEFDPDFLDVARAKYLHHWEKIGNNGTIGAISGFNAQAWKFNMQNRHDWKDKNEHGLDSETRAVFKLKMGKSLDVEA